MHSMLNFHNHFNKILTCYVMIMKYDYWGKLISKQIQYKTV